jgi:hypothetical protein
MVGGARRRSRRWPVLAQCIGEEDGGRAHMLAREER